MTSKKIPISLSEQFAAEKAAQLQQEAIEESDGAESALDLEDSAGVTNNEGLHQSYSNPYHEAPDFPLYLWAALPILLIAFGGTAAIVLAVLGTLVNFFLIHIYTRPINRYVLAGVVSFAALMLYLLIG